MKTGAGVLFNYTHIVYPLLTVLVLLLPRIVNATVPDISGTYSGTLSGTENNCGPFPGGPFTGGPNALKPENIFVTITLADPDSGAFVGSGSDSSGATISVAGLLDNNGNVISGGFSAAGSETITAGSFAAGSSFTGNKFIFNGTGGQAPTNPNVPTQICQLVNVGMTLTKINGDGLIIIPEVTNSATITNTQTLNVQVQGITSDIGGRIGNVLQGNAIGFNFNETSVKLEGQADGVNAGDELLKGFGAWLSYSRSEFENDFVSLAFEGERNTILAGIDFSPKDELVVGVAVSYEFSDIDTKVNQGNVESDGFSIIPYFGYLINDTFSVDGSFGYSSIDNDQFRTDPGTGAIITSSPESERLFGSVNLNGIWFYDNWIFGLYGGLLWAENDQDDFVESNGIVVAEQISKLRQWRLGGSLAYSFKHFEPYISLAYADDFKQTEIVIVGGRQPSNDSNDYLFSTGFRYYNNDGLSANVEYSKRLDRDNFEEDMINATMRWDF